MRNRAEELKALAQLVALALTSKEYVPTITDPEEAAAFDAAMAEVGDERRAWPGSKRREAR